MRSSALYHRNAPVRLVITLGYARENDPLLPKERKDTTELFGTIEFVMTATCGSCGYVA